MRIVAVALALGLLASAAASQTPSPDHPVRKPGWWEIRMSVAGAAPRPQQLTMRLCTDPEIEKVQPAFGVHMGKACPPMQITPTAVGWDIHAACQDHGTSVAADGHASGDLSSHYVVDVDSRIVPPPAPGVTDMKIHMDATWIGPCPAGKRPGDLETTTNVAPPAP